MQAILFTRYGAPDVLTLTPVEKPQPKENQILIKVLAAAANPLDWHRMRGAPFLVRLSDGLRAPTDPRLGADVAGRVEAVGSKVTAFQPGDEVFGITVGAFAEYALLKESLAVRKPPALSFAAAAATPVAGLTALQGLRGQLQAGQKVLINGASGGVGSFAVQFAKAWGAEVTGVCSTRNLDLVRSIGADHVVDYTQEDFTRTGERYDLIYDAVGNRSVADYRRALRPQGRCVIAGFTTLPRLVEHGVLGALLSRLGSPQVGLMGTSTPNNPDLLVLQEALASQQLVPVIDRSYSLAETGEAIRYLETGRARGKVIITPGHA